MPTRGSATTRAPCRRGPPPGAPGGAVAATTPPGGGPAAHARGPVGRAVVDDHHLERRHGLPGEAAQARVERDRVVAGGDHDRDGGPLPGTGAPHRRSPPSSTPRARSTPATTAPTAPARRSPSVSW